MTKDHIEEAFSTERALKLALEALEDMHLVELSMEDLLSWNKAVKAIKQARSAPVQEPVAIADGTFNHNCPIGTYLYTSPPNRATPLAAPAQEPCGFSDETNSWLKNVPRIIELNEELKDALNTLDYYRRRVEALQQWQSKMRDPERTIVCDIIANGRTLEPAGARYTTPPTDEIKRLSALVRAQQITIDKLEAEQAAVPLTDEQILADETLRYHFGLNGGAGPVSKKGRAVITAIKQALNDATHLAAPVQEPVAWMDASGDIYKHELWPDWNPPHTPLYTAPPAQATTEKSSAVQPAPVREPLSIRSSKDMSDADWDEILGVKAPAAQRQWVGLTAQDLIDLYNETEGDDRDDVIRLTEAKLKEKNCD